MSVPTGSVVGQSLRVNNFDLIRLIAALQVLVYHAVGHLRATDLEPLATALSYIPGVPIFFVISGFLISMSWDRAPSLVQYMWNRALRIYPALWVCLAVSLALAFIAGERPDSAGSFAAWLIAQLTFVQFYNPDWLRSFGVGVLNGSLWTIVVELQFYVVLPLLALIAGKRKGAWLALTLGSLVMMYAARSVMLDRSSMLDKLIFVTLAPYLFYFLIGVLARQLNARFPELFIGKGGWWSLAYLIWVGIEIWFKLPESGGNVLNPLSIVLLGGATVSLAFSMRDLSTRILRGNDLSYGVYIYHMPLINMLLFMGIVGTTGAAVALVATMLAALASWRFVEKPALGLKGYSMRWTSPEVARAQEVNATVKRSW